MKKLIVSVFSLCLCLCMVFPALAAGSANIVWPDMFGDQEDTLSLNGADKT